MELECKSCGYEWDYKGESDYYATCPNCHYKVKISAKAEVVAPEIKLNRLNDEENQFIRELVAGMETEDFEKIYLKYEQDEFNVLRKKIKEKVNQMRKDLERYEKVEDTLENASWDYSNL